MSKRSSFLILFFVYFFLPSGAMAQQSSYLDEYQQKWSNAWAYTVELAEAMPEDFYNYQPTEEEMSFREQLIHLVGNMAWLSSSYLGGTRPAQDLNKTDYTKVEIIAILNDGFRLAGDAALQLKPEQLEEKVEFFAGPMSKRQILSLMDDHVTHHRGQLVVYLRLNGVQPPRYRGW